MSGSNDLYAVAYDKAGNQSVANATHVVVTYSQSDTTAPTVTITNPSNGTTFTTSSITVSGMAYDSGGSGLDKVIVLNYTTGGGNAAYGLSGSSSSYSVSGISLVPGNNDIYAVAYDRAGNQSVANATHVTVSYSVPDTTAPTVTITNPSNGRVFTTSSITVSGSAADSGGSGLDKVLILNYTTGGGGQASGLSGNSSSYSVSGIGLVAGTNEIYAVAYDKAGNQSVVNATHVTVSYSRTDTTAPTVTVTSPSNGQTFSTSSITVSGSASDSGGSGLDKVFVYNSTNGSSGFRTGLSGNSASYSVGNISLNLSANQLLVQSYDKAAPTVLLLSERCTASDSHDPREVVTCCESAMC